MGARPVQALNYVSKLLKALQLLDFPVKVTNNSLGSRPTNQQAILEIPDV